MSGSRSGWAAALADGGGVYIGSGALLLALILIVLFLFLRRP